jgi:hypothetical protein
LTPLADQPRRPLEIKQAGTALVFIAPALATLCEALVSLAPDLPDLEDISLEATSARIQILSDLAELAGRDLSVAETLDGLLPRNLAAVPAAEAREVEDLFDMHVDLSRDAVEFGPRRVEVCRPLAGRELEAAERDGAS